MPGGERGKMEKRKVEGNRARREVVSILNGEGWDYLRVFTSIQIQRKERTELKETGSSYPNPSVRIREDVSFLFIFVRNIEAGVGQT